MNRSLPSSWRAEIEEWVTQQFIPTWSHAQLGRLAPNVPLHAHVVAAAARWRTWAVRLEKLRSLDGGGLPPPVHLAALTCILVTIWDLARQYVHQHFNFDIDQMRFVARGAGPQLTPEGEILLSHEMDALTAALQDAALCAGLLLVGLEALWEAQQCEGKEASECMQAAVEAMLEALKASPLAVGLLMESPLEHQQEHGVTSVSGWVATHISLEHNPRLRESLSHDGLAVATSPMSDFTTLCEQLPPATYTIWHEGKWRTLEELRTSIGAFIEHHGVDPGLNAHLSEASLRAAHQEIAQWGSRKTSLEEWSALQEASQRLDELAVRAGLSPRETEVLALQRQGFTQEQIGAQLHLPRGTVKTHAERGAEKMYKAARG